MKTLKEKNRMILSFMEVRPRMISPDRYSWSDAPFFYCMKDTPEEVMESVSKYVKYSTDWNWLMGVVKKIYSLELDCELVLIVRDALADASIDGVFDACVEFIEWYNDYNDLKIDWVVSDFIQLSNEDI